MYNAVLYPRPGPEKQVGRITVKRTIYVIEARVAGILGNSPSSSALGFPGVFSGVYLLQRAIIGEGAEREGQEPVDREQLAVRTAMGT